MKLRHYIALLLLTVAGVASAVNLTQEADSAYMNDDFVTAAALYNEIAATEGTSTNLYYNLGNCYFRMGQLGRAVLNYERALRLDPSNTDARDNLKFVNTKITDEPGDKGMFISNTINGIACRVPANVWAGFAIGSFILLLGSIAIYVFTSDIRLRKIGFFGGLLLIAVCVIANILAAKSTRYSTSSSEAVIIVPSTMLSTSPRAPKDRSEEAMLLHEGTVVTILDSLSTRIDSTTVKWYDVQVDNHNRAWISGSAIERI